LSALKTLAELNAIRDRARAQIGALRDSGENNTRLVVGMATCGIAAGARPVLATCLEEVQRRGLSERVTVTQTGCIGVCRLEPIVEVFVPGEEKVTYVNMTPEKVSQIVAEHIVNGRVKMEYTIGANQ
jgi:NADP-reducing hydrogenase subunit HndB